MGQDWQKAGEVWGLRAADWAYLMEPASRPLFQTVMSRTGVGPATAVLDIACGAGLALQVANELGASVSGIDASAAFVAIAQARVPSADLRVGTMFDLPFDDRWFDVVTSFFGIWAGCEDALVEARRVLRPGGRVALGFLGTEDDGTDAQIMAALQSLQAEADAAPSREHLTTAAEGVAESMLEGAGFSVVERGAVRATSEWPDAEMAWRAWASSGAAWAAIAKSGEEAVRDAVLSVLRPLEKPGLGIRDSSNLYYIIGRVAPPHPSA